MIVPTVELDTTDSDLVTMIHAVEVSGTNGEPVLLNVIHGLWSRKSYKMS